jgi:hypothetical protein
MDGWWSKLLIDPIAFKTSANISGTVSGGLAGNNWDPTLK